VSTPLHWIDRCLQLVPMALILHWWSTADDVSMVMTLMTVMTVIATANTKSSSANHCK